MCSALTDSGYNTYGLPNIECTQYFVEAYTTNNSPEPSSSIVASGTYNSYYSFFFEDLDDPGLEWALTAKEITSSSSTSQVDLKSSATSGPISPPAPSQTPNIVASTLQPSSTKELPPIESETPILNEAKKIGVGVGIAGFAVLCGAAGWLILRFRRKKRAEQSEPSELYYDRTEEKGQSSAS